LSDMFPIVRSTLLSRFSGISAGMSTRQGPPSSTVRDFDMSDNAETSAHNRELLLRRLGFAPDRLAVQEQVHSATVTEVNESGLVPASDAMFTVAPGLALGIKTADCVPVLLASPHNHLVAAAHAGWRGCINGLLPALLEKLNGEGIPLDELFVWIGPAARPDHYEVSDDIAAQFPDECVIHTEGQNPRVDLQRTCRVQLSAAGVPEEQIEISPYCTACHPALFYSYRRDGDRAGRMLAVIGLREP